MTDVSASTPPRQAGVAPDRARVVAQDLEVRDLTVRYGGVTPVNEVTLTVRSGEIIGLIGPNGAGKSTFIDAISGFVSPASGTISLGGVDLTRQPAHRRVRAGLVRSWQSLEIFEDVNVLENLQVGFHRLSRREQLRALLTPRKHPLEPAGLAAVEGFGLADDLHRLPVELSFSQRRVITTARALSLSPSVLLLDEPAAGMSDVRRAILAKAITALARDRGIGVLVVDHDMPFVMGLCDRIVVLNFGRVICEGTPAEVRGNPEVIAAYLGGATTEVESRRARGRRGRGAGLEVRRPTGADHGTRHGGRLLRHPGRPGHRGQPATRRGDRVARRQPRRQDHDPDGTRRRDGAARRRGLLARQSRREARLHTQARRPRPGLPHRGALRVSPAHGRREPARRALRPRTGDHALPRTRARS